MKKKYLFDDLMPGCSEKCWAFNFNASINGCDLHPPKSNSPQFISARWRVEDRETLSGRIAAAPIGGIHITDFIFDSPGMMEDLLEELPLKQEMLTFSGKQFAMPRLISWHGEKSYRYSGRTFQPSPFTKKLNEINNLLKDRLGLNFNSVLVNYYRDGKDSISWHSDDEPQIDGKCIASISLGGARRFCLRNKKTKEKQELELGNGDLFLMMDLQREWEHAIPKTSKKVEPRMNLTFRIIK